MYKHKMAILVVFLSLLGSISVGKVTNAVMLPLSGDALQIRARTELKGFTDWLQTNNQRGFIGEFGWPNNVSSTDQERWNLLAESYYKDLDANNLWATAWATGSYWGDYPLAIYQTNSSQSNYLSTTKPQAEILEKHLSTSNYRRGIQVAGGAFTQGVGEISSYSNENPGTYNTDYFL